MRDVAKWIANLRVVSASRRWRILRLAGYDVREVGIERSVEFRGRRIAIGQGSYLNFGVVFEGDAPIKIGTNVAVGPRTIFITSTHAIGPQERRAGADIVSRPITVGDGTWIGAGVIVLPGVEIGHGCVIAAGSVVTRGCDANYLYAGNPAIAKRYLLDAEFTSSE